MEPSELRETFDHFDGDKNGKIDLAEFSDLLEAIGAGMSGTDAKIGFDAIDTDGNHTIDFGEFVAWWNDR